MRLLLTLLALAVAVAVAVAVGAGYLAMKLVGQAIVGQPRGGTVQRRVVEADLHDECLQAQGHAQTLQQEREQEDTHWVARARDAPVPPNTQTVVMATTVKTLTDVLYSAHSKPSRFSAGFSLTGECQVLSPFLGEPRPPLPLV
jgi:hypothetical protein